MVENIAVLSALMWAFALTIYIGTFSREDLLEADARHVEWEQDIHQTSNTTITSYGLISKPLAEQGGVTTLFMLLSLMIAAVCHWSLNLTSCRDNPERFAAWYFYFRVPIAVSYCFFLLGMYFFFKMCYTAVDVGYPYYSMRDGQLLDVYDPDTGKMIEHSREDGADGIYIQTGAASWLKSLSNFGMILIVTALFCLHLVIMYGRCPGRS